MTLSKESSTGTLGTGSCKKFSELVGCLASDGDDSNLSNSAADHNIDTDSSLESFIHLRNLCKTSPASIATKVLTNAQLK